jgi:hypothetical protein
VKPRLEIEDHLPELQEPQPSSLVTLMIIRKPELDFPLEVEEQFLVTAEQWSEYALEVVEPISQSWRLEMLTTQPRQREEDGLELEVSLWTQSTIPMVVVINNILDIHQQSADSLLMVKRSVLLLPEEQVLLEEEERI